MRKALIPVVPMLVIGFTYSTTDAAPSVASTPQLQLACPPPFVEGPATLFQSEDRNRNFIVCRLTTPSGHVVTIDDRPTT